MPNDAERCRTDSGRAKTGADTRDRDAAVGRWLESGTDGARRQGRPRHTEPLYGFGFFVQFGRFHEVVELAA